MYVQIHIYVHIPIRPPLDLVTNLLSDFWTTRKKKDELCTVVLANHAAAIYLAVYIQVQILSLIIRTWTRISISYVVGTYE